MNAHSSREKLTMLVMWVGSFWGVVSTQVGLLFIWFCGKRMNIATMVLFRWGWEFFG